MPGGRLGALRKNLWAAVEGAYMGETGRSCRALLRMAERLDFILSVKGNHWRDQSSLKEYLESNSVQHIYIEYLLCLRHWTSIGNSMINKTLTLA